ncbi:hypothetical protein [Duganella sp. FT27W]|uniref:hypothetical protein n=1 Tax=Duganella sp. FT27W TaxID=2654636 RepID=UPI00128DD015|nr:hypothetical protein [Duganella sp. FT27W]MPQ57639.1 hypothetical protein [Duganella sp. FT27W]
MGWFSLRGKLSANTAAIANLGAGLVALRLDVGDVAPPGTVLVVFSSSGQARRLAPGKVASSPGDTVFCFHPGPYTVDLAPFAAAPEWGLRVRLLVDAPNPHAEQQRFDLFLYAEHHEQGGQLSLVDLGAALQSALQSELAQGALDLPPCTTLEEWHAFRSGFNQLLYTRYGLTVDDCVPVDLGGQVDFADVLRARALAASVAADDAMQAALALHTMSALPQAEAPDAQPTEPTLQPLTPAVSQSDSRATSQSGSQPLSKSATQPTAQSTTPAALSATAGAASQTATQPALHSMPPPPQQPTQIPSQLEPQPQTQQLTPPTRPETHALQDNAGLRRLFVELPVLSRHLRLLVLPQGAAIFQAHQSLLLRLDMATLNVDTMPSLAWAAPDQPLGAADQARRTAATTIAVAALDEAWSLLARLHLAGSEEWTALLDDADRICANLETGLALRRAPYVPRQEPAL